MSQPELDNIRDMLQQVIAYQKQETNERDAQNTQLKRDLALQSSRNQDLQHQLLEHHRSHSCEASCQNAEVQTHLANTVADLSKLISSINSTSHCVCASAHRTVSPSLTTQPHTASRYTAFNLRRQSIGADLSGLDSIGKYQSSHGRNHYSSIHDSGNYKSTWHTRHYSMALDPLEQKSIYEPYHEKKTDRYYASLNHQIHPTESYYNTPFQVHGFADESTDSLLMKTDRLPPSNYGNFEPKLSNKSQNLDTSPTFRDLQQEVSHNKSKDAQISLPETKYIPAQAPVAKPVMPKKENYSMPQLIEKTPPRSSYGHHHHHHHHHSTVTHTYTPMKSTSVSYTQITPPKVAVPKKVEVKKHVHSRNQTTILSAPTYTPGPRTKVSGLSQQIWGNYPVETPYFATLGLGWNFHNMSRTHATSSKTAKLMRRIVYESLQHQIEELHHQQEELEHRAEQRAAKKHRKNFEEDEKPKKGKGVGSLLKEAKSKENAKAAAASKTKGKGKAGGGGQSSFMKLMSFEKKVISKKSSTKKASSTLGSTGVSGISKIGGSKKHTAQHDAFDEPTHDTFDEPHHDAFEEPAAPKPNPASINDQNEDAFDQPSQDAFEEPQEDAFEEIPQAPVEDDVFD